MLVDINGACGGHALLGEKDVRLREKLSTTAAR